MRPIVDMRPPLAKPYIGRFAPSPTGPLHAGSLMAALASWLDARAHGGQWIVRIEDVDTTRCIPGMDAVIVQQLASLGMTSDTPLVYQSERTALYEAALRTLQAQGQTYRCYCSRRQIAQQGLGIYPGTCRVANQNKASKSHRPTDQYAQRLQLGDSLIHWFDRRLGAQSQDVAREVGDFVIQRADGLFAYQLAVVVDDYHQGITHVVRGEDLLDNTARQIALQQALGYPTPHYLHVPLVLAADGQKLSKQNGATPLDTTQPMQALCAAAARLGLRAPTDNTPRAALAAWVQEWRALG